MRSDGDPSYNRIARITLLREPGVDCDRYDRELRYVHVDGSDLGEWLVSEYEIGVHEGHNDANRSYIAELRENDRYTGLQCCGSPTFDSGAGTDVDVDVDVNQHNDDDGESRFCRRRWYY